MKKIGNVGVIVVHSHFFVHYSQIIKTHFIQASNVPLTVLPLSSIARGVYSLNMDCPSFSRALPKCKISYTDSRKVFFNNSWQDFYSTIQVG